MGFSKFEFQPIESFHYLGGYLVWVMQKKQLRDTLFLADEVVIHKICVLHQFGTILDKYLIKKRKKWQLTVSQSAVDMPNNEYNILTAVINKWIAPINKDKIPELSVVFISQPVVADHGPYRDLPCKLPWDKTFRFTEKKQEAAHPSTLGEEDGSTSLAHRYQLGH